MPRTPNVRPSIRDGRGTTRAGEAARRSARASSRRTSAKLHFRWRHRGSERFFCRPECEDVQLAADQGGRGDAVTDRHLPLFGEFLGQAAGASKPVALATPIWAARLRPILAAERSATKKCGGDDRDEGGCYAVEHVTSFGGSPSSVLIHRPYGFTRFRHVQPAREDSIPLASQPGCEYRSRHHNAPIAQR